MIHGCIFSVGGFIELRMGSVPLTRAFRFKLLGRIGRIVVIIFLVEVGKGLTEIFDFELRRNGPKIESVDLDRTDEPGQSDLLESIVDERADALSKSFPVRTGGGGPPVDVYGHYMCEQRRPAQVSAGPDVRKQFPNLTLDAGESQSS
jgi:hypothetical protein